MAAPALNPFTDADCECLTRIIQRGGAVEELLGCLQDCGIPLTELRAENKQTVDLAAKLKAKFHPDKT